MIALVWLAAVATAARLQLKRKNAKLQEELTGQVIATTGMVEPDTNGAAIHGR